MKKNNTIKKQEQGFTLVELLAVISILGILMIIATPSVLSTIEVARKESFIKYIEKVFNKGQEQYMSDYNLLDIPVYETTEYIYDIETDLGLDSTGNYRGIYSYVYCETKGEYSCWDDGYNKDDRELVLLYNDEYLYFGFRDAGTPKESDIYSFTALPDEFQSLLKNYSYKEFYAHNESISWCGGEKYIINGGVDSTGKKYSILAHTTVHPEHFYPDWTCKGENPEYIELY